MCWRPAAPLPTAARASVLGPHETILALPADISWEWRPDDPRNSAP